MKFNFDHVVDIGLAHSDVLDWYMDPQPYAEATPITKFPKFIVFAPHFPLVTATGQLFTKFYSIFVEIFS